MLVIGSNFFNAALKFFFTMLILSFMNHCSFFLRGIGVFIKKLRNKAASSIRPPVKLDKVWEAALPVHYLL